MNQYAKALSKAVGTKNYQQIGKLPPSQDSIAENDKKTCKLCKKNSGKMGGYAAPLHPNCRCMVRGINVQQVLNKNK